MIRLSMQHSPTLTHGKLLQSPLRMPISEQVLVHAKCDF
jgi:hypothetical protein